MTLQELLQRYGIHRPIDLAHAAKIDRRHAWMLWHGQRHIGGRVALRIFESKKIPVEALLRTTAASQPAPRGRPRKVRREPAEP